MANRTIFDGPTIPRLITLLDEVRRGQILIPAFQRPFVWNDDQRLLLLDSVAKGMPIGSFLVWRTHQHRLETLSSVGPFELPSREEGQQTTRTYLLDGHQRLTTLFTALGWHEDDADEAGQLATQGARWPIFYDLEEEEFTLRSRGEPPLTWLPVALLMQPRPLFAYQKKLMEADFHAESDRAEELAIRVKDYQIPVVPLISEDLDLVTDSFVRVNSQGKRMRETHMVRALAYSRFDMEARLEQLREQISPRGWGALDEQILLNTLKIRFGLDVYQAGPRELHKRLQDHDFKTAFGELELCIGHAIDFLNRCGVRGPQALPYAYQVTALSEAARRIGSLLEDAVFERLQRWFWITTYTGYFTGMTSSRIREAVSHVEALAEKEGDALPSARDQEVPALRNYHHAATRTRAFVLRLIEQIDTPELRVAAQTRYGAQGATAVAKLLPEGRGDTPANRVVCATDDEVGELRAALRGGSQIEDALLARYVIPADALESLRAGNTDAFFEARQRKLDKLEQAFIETLKLRFVESPSE